MLIFAEIPMNSLAGAYLEVRDLYSLLCYFNDREAASCLVEFLWFVRQSLLPSLSKFAIKIIYWQ